MRRLIPRPVKRSEWLRLRLDYFNASDAAALFGEHEFTSLGDIAVRKISRDVTESGTAATRRGVHLEAAVAEWWGDERGVITYEPADLFVCGDVMATLDRCIVGVEDESVEIKTTARRVLEPLPAWWWQAQAQMLATGFARVHLVVLDGTLELQTFQVDADMQAQCELAGRASKFMDTIRRGEVPADVELSYDHHHRLTPVDDGSVVDLDDAGRALVVRLAAARKLRKAADDEEERTKASLAQLLGLAAVATFEGRPVLTWKTQTRASVDVTWLRRERPDLAEEFTTTTSLRVMRLTERDGPG